MPNTFAQSNDGILYVASGMDAVMRWDGQTNTAEEAGVPAPEGAVSLSASEAGSIIGVFYGYVRFVDRLGNVSNLSPIGDPLNAIGLSGNITGATNANPIVVTSASHGLESGNIIFIRGVEGNTTANGVRKVTVLTDHTFSLQTVDGDNIVGGGAYTGGGEWYLGIGEITFNNVAVPEDPRVVRRQILRNASGESAVLYVDIDTDDLTSESFTSATDDEALTAKPAVALFDQSLRDLAISRYTPPPNDRKIILNTTGRMLYAGNEEYRQGAVEVEFGSNTVQGIGTEWLPAVRGRNFFLRGHGGTYTIESVDATSQTITLTDPYLGPTTKFGSYKISSPRARRRGVDWSEAGLPEAVPPTNSASPGMESGSREVTALMRLGSYVYILEAGRIYSWNFFRDPAPTGVGSGDGVIFPRAHRGTVSERCIAIVDNTAFILDEQGIYQFSGNESRPLSVPIRDLFGGDSSHFRIHWGQSRFFHAVYDSIQDVIRWFVTLDGSFYPRHAIAYSRLSRNWWVEEYPVPICSSAIGLSGNFPVVFLGSTSGRVFTLSNGWLDLADANTGTTRGAFTTPAFCSVIDSQANFSSDVVGSPVSIVDGVGKGQWRTIVEASGTTLRLDRPWTHKPGPTSRYQVGGIHYRVKFGTFRLAHRQRHTTRRLQVFGASNQQDGTFDIKLYFDRDTQGAEMGVTANEQGVTTVRGQREAVCDLTKGDGMWQLFFDGIHPGSLDGKRRVTPELSGVQGSGAVRFYELELEGAGGFGD